MFCSAVQILLLLLFILYTKKLIKHCVGCDIFYANKLFFDDFKMKKRSQSAIYKYQIEMLYSTRNYLS